MMHSALLPKRACPHCGTAPPPNAPEGLCPPCLGALNLAESTVFATPEELRKAPLSPEEIARHFPQLEILECLGRGGMGVVYKARQIALNRIVALKLLAPEREQETKFTERFSREAQALAQLAHRNIVMVHDFGRSNGYCYLLMEFVDGVSLRELLQWRRLTPEEALAIVPALCEALQYAHERGVVHRDVKPENLLLSKDGQIKVVDFGIAEMLGTHDRGPEEKPVGTPGYMAPEQRDTPHFVDSRADVYSLGVVFYEMLTGELPADEPEAPSRKAAVDAWIDEVVLRALENSPDLRWQTAAEMQLVVEAAAAISGIAPRAGERGATLRQPRSRWWLLPLVAGMAALCSLLSLGLFGRFDYGWGIAGAIVFAVMIVYCLLPKAEQERFALLAACLLAGALLAMPVLLAGVLFFELRDEGKMRSAFLSPNTRLR